MFGAIGALMALLHREHQRAHGPSNASPSGQVIDVALYEAVFAVTESLLPEYDGYGIICQRTGNILPGLTPSNIYACQEGKWVAIGGNADSVFKRLARAIGRADLAEDPASWTIQAERATRSFWMALSLIGHHTIPSTR